MSPKGRNCTVFGGCGRSRADLPQEHGSGWYGLKLKTFSHPHFAVAHAFKVTHVKLRMSLSAAGFTLLATLSPDLCGMRGPLIELSKPPQGLRNHAPPLA
jgi:hypothetical protein